MMPHIAWRGGRCRRPTCSWSLPLLSTWRRRPEVSTHRTAWSRSPRRRPAAKAAADVEPELAFADWKAYAGGRCPAT